MRSGNNLGVLLIVALLILGNANEIEIDDPSDVSSHSQNQPIIEPHQANQQTHTQDSQEHLSGQQGQEHEQGHQSQAQGSGHHYLKPTQGKFWINVLIAAFLTCVGGFCSGMGVGLMSIEKIQLEIMSKSKDAQERKIAKKILEVVSDHHLFLVTLLVANAMALETLPLIVHSLMPDWAAIIFSTIIVLIGGEIIPQAYCTGPKKITIAYHAAPIILLMIKLLCIIVIPMARGLDALLGKHSHQRIQHKDFANFLGNTQSLKSTQKLLLTSILELRTEKVTEIMTKLENMYMLSSDQPLIPAKISEINKKDYSYVLIYKGKNKGKIIGVIKTKQFAIEYLKKISESKEKNIYTIMDFFDHDHGIMSVYQDTNLLEMLMLFQAKSYRFALVIAKKRKVFPGVNTLMYSKRDMIASKQQGDIVGVVFLYRIFQEIAEYNDQIAKNTVKVLQGNKSMQMKQLKSSLKEPLIK